MRTLEIIRKNIVKIQADITKVNATLPPQEQLLASLREQLELAKIGWDKFLSSAAEAVALGTSVELFHDHSPSVKLELALGMAVATRGVDSMVAEILAESALYSHPETVRMTASDKKKELSELRVALYTLELEEEMSLNGETRRDDVHPGAVLGIPLEFIKDSHKYDFEG